MVYGGAAAELLMLKVNSKDEVTQLKSGMVVTVMHCALSLCGSANIKTRKKPIFLSKCKRFCYKIKESKVQNFKELVIGGKF